MHYLHLISVQASNEEEALELVDSALDPYGRGDVWDYYTVGGRWDGYFSNGKNTLRYTDNPKEFIEVLEKHMESRNRIVSAAAHKLMGVGVLQELAQGTPISDYAQFGDEHLILWEFCKACSLRYTSTSGFYDYTEGMPADATELLSRVSLDTGDQEWLVVVDLHN